MNKDQLIELANETLKILDNGEYMVHDGTIVIRNRVLASELLTYVYGPGQLSPILPSIEETFTPIIEITTEGTIEALQRLSANEGGEAFGHLGCLNFASAKNPGGGFLKGTMAQEESLAYSSSLYKSLLKANSYYESNRALLHEGKSALYTDLAVLSLDVLFFRDNQFNLLEETFSATVITSPAPNAGAIREFHPDDVDKIKETFANRMDLVFRLAVREQLQYFVLGAWGCGIFKNDPKMVAELFKDNLEKYGKYFKHIVFAIYGGGENYDTFKSILA